MVRAKYTHISMYRKQFINTILYVKNVLKESLLINQFCRSDFVKTVRLLFYLNICNMAFR